MVIVKLVIVLVMTSVLTQMSSFYLFVLITSIGFHEVNKYLKDAKIQKTCDLKPSNFIEQVFTNCFGKYLIIY